MTPIKLALALLLSVLTSLAAAPAVAAPARIDQAAWNGLKQEVRLPNGMGLAYVELGDPNGKPLLLLHGYTDSSRSWSLIAPHLAHYRLLIPDQRGHGAAAAPPCCYGISDYAYDAVLLMDALGVRRAAIAGHSMGSMVAIHMAAQYPERVASIVLIGSTALAPVQRGAWLYDQVAALKWPLDPASDFMREWHPANQPTPVDPVFAEAAMTELLAVPEPVWRGVMRELAGVPIGRHAADVNVPVLILSGGKDPLFPAEHHASLLRAFPGAEAHVFPDLGHNPIWERPADLGAAITRFLGR